MMQSRVWKIVSLVMVMVFPLSMMAGSPAAMAVPSGAVNVNGSALSHATAIFAGDRIETASGTLSMTMPGSSVQIGPKSSVQLASNQLQVASGGARILTSSGLAGQIRNVSVRPASDTKSVYTVAERDGKILVAALEGSVTLDDGRQQILVAANHAVAIPVQDNTQGADQPKCKAGDKKCEKAVKNCKGDKACEASAASAAAGGAAAGAGAGAAGAAGAGAGAAAGASVSTAVAVGVAAAAAGASAAASYGIAVATEPPTSPTGP
jgi:hypothetical protein